MLTTLLLELGDLSSGQHVGATACNIVARNTLHAFGNHVALTMLHSFGQPCSMGCNMIQQCCIPLATALLICHNVQRSNIPRDRFSLI